LLKQGTEMLHIVLVVFAVALVLVLLPAMLVAVIGGMAHAAGVVPRTLTIVLLAATVLGSFAHLTHGYPRALAFAFGLLLAGQLSIEFLREYRGI
jgi:hypothetical protein